MSRAPKNYPKNTLTLREVGLRAGLQMVRRFPGTQAKAAWLTAEAAAGVRHFEVRSFLPATRMPQSADLREVIALCDQRGLYSAALVLSVVAAREPEGRFRFVHRHLSGS